MSLHRGHRDVQDLREEMEKYGDKSMEVVYRAYQKSLESIQMQIARIYMEYSQDGELLISRRQRFTILKRLEDQIKEQANILGKLDEETTTELLKEIYNESFYKVAYIIDKGLEISINFAILRPEFIQAAVFMPIEGEMFSDRIWTNKEKLVKKLRSEIERGMIQGDSIDKMARRIRRTFGSSAYESKRLMRTEMARCMAMAQDKIYKESGVVKQILFDATLDQKTSDICEKHDGHLYDIESDNPKPPLHPNCRSCIVPVVDGWSPTKKRENMKNSNNEKPLIDYSGYDTWIASKNIK